MRIDEREARRIGVCDHVGVPSVDVDASLLPVRQCHIHGGGSVRERVAGLRVGDGGLPAVGGLDDRLLFAGVVAASKAEEAVPVNRGCSLTGDARESLTGVTGRYPAFKEG